MAAAVIRLVEPVPARPRVRVQYNDSTGHSARRIGALDDYVRLRSQAYGPNTPMGFARASGGFDATGGHRRLAKWRPTDATANELLASAGSELLRRVRDLARNDAYAGSAGDVFVSAAVGTGIKPSSLIKDKNLRAQVHLEWKRWTDESDADGLLDYYGQQAQVARAVFDGGEAFVRLRYRRAGDMSTVPLQLQVFEAEQLPYDLNRTLKDGNTIRMGIELDDIGRRVAYHFFRNHPGDGPVTLAGDLSQFTRVPADQVLHVFPAYEGRPGQLRGVPRLQRVLVPLKLLGDYDDAELERMRMTSLFVAFVKKAYPNVDDGTAQAIVDDLASGPDDPLAPLQPGLIQDLKPGEEVQFSQPIAPGGNYNQFQYRTLTRVASGAGVPYSRMTGDVTQANYSNERAAQLAFKSRVEPFQHHCMVYQMNRPVWAAWWDRAVLFQRLKVKGYASKRADYLDARSIPPPWPWVDPEKDRKAAILGINHRLIPRDDVSEAEGYDPEENDQRIADGLERAEGLGIDSLRPFEAGKTAFEAEESEARAEAAKNPPEPPPQAAPEDEETDEEDGEPPPDEGNEG
jgi:lambda family phage portal protein